MNYNLSVNLIEQMNMEELNLWNNYCYFVMMNYENKYSDELSKLHREILRLVYIEQYA
jgi:hypothetical protein